MVSQKALLNTLRAFLASRGDWLILPVLLTTLFLMCCFPLVDNDLWWHLRTGELIWQKGEIPRVDAYTYKDAGRPWIDLHWGFQLLLAGLYHLGGADLLVLFGATACVLAAAIGWGVNGQTLPGWLKGLLWVFPMILLWRRATVRAEGLSMIFLGCTLWILSRVEKRPNLIWWLVPLQLVWTNCHSFFVLGLVVQWCFVADRLVARFIPRGIAWGPPLGKILPAVILATLVCFLNPYFHEGFFFPLVLMRKFASEREMYASISEFQRPLDRIREAGWRHVMWISLIGLAAMSLVSFILPLFRGRWSPFRILVMIGFGWLGWSAIRNANLFAMVAITVTCGNLDDFVRLPAAEAAPVEVPAKRRGWMKWGLNAGVAAAFGAWIVAIVTQAWGASPWTGGNRRFALGERPFWYAHGAANAARYPGLPPYAFVTSMKDAPVFMYHNGPERKVFMDSRLEVTSQETWQQFETILKLMRDGNPRWMDLIRTPDGKLPVIIADSRYSTLELAGIFSSSARLWRPVFVDQAGMLLVEENVARRLNLPRVDPRSVVDPPDFW